MDASPVQLETPRRPLKDVAATDTNKRSTVLSFLSALKHCGTKQDLERGKALHSDAVEAGYHTNKYIQNALVNMYSRCRSMNEARSIFDNMSHRDVVSWTSLILGYVENGESLVAINMFMRMDCEPNSITFVAVLKACASGRQFSLENGIAIHGIAKRYGFEKDVLVATNVVRMYAKCGSMRDAHEVFNRMARRDVVTWNILILGYVEDGQCLVAMDLFTRMDCEPSAVTYVAVLKACACLAGESVLNRRFCLEKGMEIHGQVRERRLDTNVFVGNNLVEMYTKCGSMREARDVFDTMVRRDAVSWTSLVLGYKESGDSSLAVDLFMHMDCKPDCVAFVAVLKACAELDPHSCLVRGRTIHKRARELGFTEDLRVANSLVTMYSNCGCMGHARAVFDNMSHRDVVSWTSLIVGYVRNGESLIAMELFMSMDCEPQSFTFVAVLKALASEKHLLWFEKGTAIHRNILRYALDVNLFVGNSLVDMYSSYGRMEQARFVFDSMLHMDTVSWTSIIQGYVENAESIPAMDLFLSMDCESDSITYVAALKACGNIVALRAGERIHAEICKTGLETNRMVANSLVDFYGKCSSMAAAEHVFNMKPSGDTVSWNALIAGYASIGEVSSVFSLVNKMQEAGLQMDSITWVLILTVCSQTGMIEEGKKYFKSMSKYNIEPTMEHYTCMVDMLGRFNRLQEALTIIYEMPFEGDCFIWTTLLGACKTFNNLEVGKVAFEKLMACDEKDGAAYVLMSDMCTKVGMKQNESKVLRNVT